ncbi:MAG: hypothetical protein Kow0027_11230 [Saprospiraceae bacterium]
MPKSFYTFLCTSFIVLFSVAGGLAQCPITVDAGPDRFVCNVGEQTTLLGSVSGNYLDVLWSPATGLSDPTSLTPSATVTGPMTYTLTASAYDPNAPNLVTNPAFEAGNTGFTSTYTYTSTPITPGTYYITTSPSVVISNFPPCDDHTFGNGTGNMMLVNGAGVPNTPVWCQTIPVMPNTTYFMSAWVTSSPIDPAALQFYVNQNPVGSVFNSSGGGCSWEQFSASWNSGAAVTADLCIVTQNSGNGLFGDDYALDDIYFGAACTESDMVNVDVVSVEAQAPATAFLLCNSLPGGIQLDGSASTSGPNVSYQWTTSGGNIVSGANTAIATVNAEGTYTLTVTYDDGNVLCQDMATVVVLPDPNLVFANAGAPPPATVNCANPTLTLDGSGSSTGADITYSWVPAAGIVSGANSLQPVVNQGGTYTLTVTNTASGCTATASVVVDENFDTPVAAAAANDTLTCSNATLSLDGTGSSTGPNISYLWETTDGHILSGSSTLNNCVVDSAGVYQLTVTNTASQCTAVAFAVVLADTSAPVADGGPDQALQCAQNSLNLDGSGSSSGTAFTYLWMTSDGHIASGANSLSPLVDSAGTYLLTVTDTTTGCFATDTVLVTTNQTGLSVTVAASGNLDCQHDYVTLEASANPLPANALFLWTTTEGHIALDDSSEVVIVTDPGTYYLQLIDTLSACSGLDSVVVGLDTVHPVVSLPASDTLTCFTTAVTLAPVVQATAPDSMHWEALNGGQFVAVDSLSGAATIDQGGLYVFFVQQLGNGCVARDTVEVVNLLDSIEVLLAEPPAITCTMDSVSLDASATALGPGAGFVWSTTGGNFLSGTNSLEPIVNQGGIYTLTIYDTLGHCIGMDSVAVVYDTVHPTINYLPDGQLTCVDTVYFPEYQVDFGGIDSAFQQLSFEVLSGHLWDGSTTDSMGFDAGGTYVLQAWNQATGCTTRDTFHVTVDSLMPQISFDPPPTFLCSSDSVQLSATASPAAAFSWSTNSGLLLSGDTTAMPWVGAPGEYFATATLASNGCSSTDTLTVPSDSNAPAISLDGAPLSCADQVQQISASITGTGPFDLNWSTTDGQIIGGSTGQQITVGQPGTYTISVTDLSNACLASQNITIGIDTLAPQLAVLPVPALNCLDDTVQLIVASQTGGNLSWQWATSDGSILSTQDSLALVDAGGSYQVLVTNTANGCAAEALITVDQDTTAPVPDIAWFQNLNCANPTIQLFGSSQGTGPFSWQWTTTDGLIAAGEDEQDLTISAGGTYQLLVTDLGNGCTATTSETIPMDTLAPQISISVNGQLSCANSTAMLSATASGTGPFSWQWATGDGLIAAGEDEPTAVVAAAGTYELTVTDQSNGCSALAAQWVGQDTASPVVSIAGGEPITCANTTVSLTATTSGTGPFSWQWTTSDGLIAAGEAEPTAVVAAAGTYELTVTDQSNGCSALAAQWVGQDTAAPVLSIAGGEPITCANQTVSLTATTSGTGPFSWQWTTGDGLIAAGEDEPTAVVAAAGTYELTVTDQSNGCSAIAAQWVGVDTLHPDVSAGPDVFLTCSETITALSGISQTPGVLYQWSTVDGNIVFGATTTMPAVDQPGTYTLTVTNPQNGCTASDETLALTNVLEAFEVGKENADCASGFGRIVFGAVTGGTPPFEYSVDGGNSWTSQSVIDSLPPGDYPVSIKDAQACRLDSSLSIQPPPVIVAVLEPEHLIRLGESVALVPQLSFDEGSIAQISWSPTDGLSCADCLEPLAGPAHDTEYSLSITDSSGCVALAYTTVLVDRRPAYYVPNAFSPNDDGINDELLVFSRPGLVKQVNSFRVFDRWGGLVFENYDFPPATSGYGWDGRKDGRRMHPGVYVWMAELLLVDDSTVLLKGEVVLVR